MIYYTTSQTYTTHISSHQRGSFYGSLSTSTLMYIKFVLPECYPRIKDLRRHWRNADADPLTQLQRLTLQRQRLTLQQFVDVVVPLTQHLQRTWAATCNFVIEAALVDELAMTTVGDLMKTMQGHDTLRHQCAEVPDWEKNVVLPSNQLTNPPNRGVCLMCTGEKGSSDPCSKLNVLPRAREPELSRIRSAFRQSGKSIEFCLLMRVAIDTFLESNHSITYEGMELTKVTRCMTRAQFAFNFLIVHGGIGDEGGFCPISAYPMLPLPQVHRYKTGNRTLSRSQQALTNSVTTRKYNHQIVGLGKDDVAIMHTLPDKVYTDLTTTRHTTEDMRERCHEANRKWLSPADVQKQEHLYNELTETIRTYSDPSRLDHSDPGQFQQATDAADAMARLLIEEEDDCKRREERKKRKEKKPPAPRSVAAELEGQQPAVQEGVARAEDEAATASESPRPLEPGADAAPNAPAERQAGGLCPSTVGGDAGDSSSVACISLASSSFSTGRPAESTVGGTHTCIICFADEKSHAAVPCGHQCACETCAKTMKSCPICRTAVAQWLRVRVA